MQRYLTESLFGTLVLGMLQLHCRHYVLLKPLLHQTIVLDLIGLQCHLLTIIVEPSFELLFKSLTSDYFIPKLAVSSLSK